MLYTGFVSIKPQRSCFNWGTINVSDGEGALLNRTHDAMLAGHSASAWDCLPTPNVQPSMDTEHQQSLPRPWAAQAVPDHKLREKRHWPTSFTGSGVLTGLLLMHCCQCETRAEQSEETNFERREEQGQQDILSPQNNDGNCYHLVFAQNFNICKFLSICNLKQSIQRKEATDAQSSQTKSNSCDTAHIPHRTSSLVALAIFITIQNVCGYLINICIPPWIAESRKTRVECLLTDGPMPHRRLTPKILAK